MEQDTRGRTPATDGGGSGAGDGGVAADGTGRGGTQPRDEGAAQDALRRKVQRRAVGKGRLTPARRRRFLDVLAATANVRRAAAAVEMAATSFYRLRARDPQFATLWRIAMDDALVRLEAELLARALGEEDAPVGDGEAAGAAGTLDPKLGIELLKRVGTATAANGDRRYAVTSRRHVAIEDVTATLERRLTALHRRDGQ